MRYILIGKRMAICFLLISICVVIAAIGGATKAVQTVGSTKGKQHPIYSVNTSLPHVSLGINCAWDNADIPVLLKILDEHNVKATFFILGDWCDEYPESVKQIYDAGHEIGSHSDTHADMAKLDQASMIREIQDSAAKLKAVTGQMPELFRPPSGSYNSKVVEVIRQQGFYPIQWDCDSVDYKNPTTQQMSDRIMKNLRNGSILLFHSGAKNTPEALPVILKQIQSKGYTFVPVGELIYRGDYTVDFEGRQHKAD